MWSICWNLLHHFLPPPRPVPLFHQPPQQQPASALAPLKGRFQSRNTGRNTMILPISNSGLPHSNHNRFSKDFCFSEGREKKRRRWWFTEVVQFMPGQEKSLKIIWFALFDPPKWVAFNEPWRISMDFLHMVSYPQRHDFSNWHIWHTGLPGNVTNGLNHHIFQVEWNHDSFTWM